jgi:hypothetical protein
VDEWQRLVTTGVVCLEKMVFHGASLKHFVELESITRSYFPLQMIPAGGRHGYSVPVVIVERSKTESVCIPVARLNNR